MSAIMTATPTFDQVVEAARRIESGIIRTPCVRSAALSELCDANVGASWIINSPQVPSKNAAVEMR